jgi:hypothetical protein
MGCLVGKKAAVEPLVISPVPVQVQSGVKLNLFTVSEEESVVEVSQRRKPDHVRPG